MRGPEELSELGGMRLLTFRTQWPVARPKLEHGKLVLDPALLLRPRAGEEVAPWAPAVDASLVFLFGEPLAPTGQEDRIFVILDATSEATLERPPGDELVANLGRMYIRTRTP